MAKRRTLKQINALKKMQAGLRKYRKKMGIGKKKPRKNPVKKSLYSRSKTTKKKSGPRLIRRRKKKQIKGYFPNPKTQYYLKQGSKYYNGGGFSTSKSNAVYFNSKEQATKIANDLVGVIGKAISLRMTGKKK